MADGGVRDLLVKLSLDTSNFTQGQSVLKSGITTLKTELKNLETDGSIEDQADKIKGNLAEQIALVREQVSLYEAEILKMNTALQGAEGDAKKESYLVKQMDAAQSHLNNSKTYLAELEAKMKAFDAGNFSKMMQEWSSFFMSLDHSYNSLIGDWAKNTSDSAYDIAASREKAMKEMYKIAGDEAGLEWLERTESRVQKAILDIPVTYEHFMDVMADAMQAGGQAYTDAYEFAEIFTKLESAAPTLAGGGGVASFGRFLSLMGATSEEYEKLASVVVEMGNHFATTEDQIVNTANSAAGALTAAGIDATDGLALVTASLAFGMQEAAVASSLEKLTSRMAKAADFADSGYSGLLETLREMNPEIESATQAMVAFDSGGMKMAEFVGAMNLPKTQVENMMKNAMLLEQTGEILGMSADQFADFYQADPANALISFYGALGAIDASGSESLLSLLDSLEITEIRTGRMARNFALNSDTMLSALMMARDAYGEGAALEREFASMADTEEAAQVSRRNATENALQAMGATVTAMRQPFQDFFAEVKQGFAEMPDWVQTGVAGTIEVLGGIGNAIGAVGDVASGIYYSGEVIKQAKALDWSKVGSGLLTAGKAVGKVAIPAAVIFGFVELARVTADLASNTEIISQKLANVQINVDQKSKEEALKSIEEVRRASEELSNPELDAKYAQNSKIVKMGFGTTNMFATATAYEMARYEKDLEQIYQEYGAVLADLGDRVLTETDPTQQRLIQSQIQQTNDQLRAAVSVAEKQYQASMNQLINGALQQQDGAARQLAEIGKKYNYLDLFLQGANLVVGSPELNAFINENRDQLMAILDETGVNYVKNNRTVDFTNAAKQMYEQLAKDVEGFTASNPDLGNLFSIMLSSGSLESMDLSAVEGELLSAIQALDILQIGARGAKKVHEIGKLSMAGLADGVAAGGGEVETSAKNVGQGMIDAIREVLQIHSPSVIMQGIGGDAVQGLADGVTAAQGTAVAAIRQVGRAMQIEAADQAAKVAAILSLAGYGPAMTGAAAAGGIAGASGRAAAGQVTNVFHIQGGSLAEQQNVVRLSQKIEKIAQKTNAGLGLVRI